MPERFAFTAKYWGRRAVVCRADEDRPGPIVVQEFGQFESWTTANTFARRLNEGLDIDPVEANRIVICSELLTSELMRAVQSMDAASDQPRGQGADKFLRAQFQLAELELALTFCRLVASNPNRPSDRLVRNARKALFNAMHSVVYSELADSHLQLITDRMQSLVEALQVILPQQRESALPAEDAGPALLDNPSNATSSC
jgi:hypothetical protein